MAVFLECLDTPSIFSIVRIAQNLGKTCATELIKVVLV